jgi:hypothetical protein
MTCVIAPLSSSSLAFSISPAVPMRSLTPSLVPAAPRW